MILKLIFIRNSVLNFFYNFLIYFFFFFKCNCNDFLKLVKALVRLKNELIGLFDRINTEIEVLKLKNILLNILKYLDDIEIFSSNIDPEAAK